MAKILTDEEMGQIIWDTTHDPGIIDCGDHYIHFLEDLGTLISTHFGGTRGDASCPVDGSDPGPGSRYCCAFEVDENVPSDGGVFKGYDTDITWKDGKVTEKVS